MNGRLYTLSKRLLIAVGLGMGLTVALLWTLGAGQLPTAYAASYTVTRGDDPVPDGCNPGDCSLREAVIAANANAGPDTITLPPDTYILSIAGAGEDAADTGDLDITESVDINGAGPSTTIIDGDRIDSVFEVLTGSVTFSGVTIQRAYRSAGDGGGIRYDAEGGTLTIVNSKFFSNTARSDGGGISMEEDADNASLSVTNSIFISNTADTDEGGAINIDSTTNTVTIVDSDFIGNTADDEGGALHFDDNVYTITIGNSDFIGNTAEDEGGALHTDGNFYTISIDGSLFRENRTTDAGGSNGGGAINIEGITTTITINHSQFISNTAIGSEGGALRFDMNNQVVTIRGSTFISNTAGGGDGGGALCIEEDSTTVEIYRSRFYSNTTESFESGGAISAVGDAVNLQIHACGFRGNTSDWDGGAIQFASDGGILEVSNSTLSGNEALDFGGGINVRANVTATVSGLGDLGAMDTRERDTVPADEHQADVPDEPAEPDEDGDDEAVEQDSGDVHLLDTAVLRVRLNNVTIGDNVADSNAGGAGDGGGISVHPDLIGRVEVANSIIADNQDLSPAPLEPDCSAAAGGIVSFGYNLVGDDSGCNWTPATDDQVGTGGLPVDPLLGPIQHTPATPAFYPLQVGSPAIDAANPAAVGGFPGCKPRDQRGVSRPKGGRCDIGAYESGGDIYLSVVMKQ